MVYDPCVCSQSMVYGRCVCLQFRVYGRCVCSQSMVNELDETDQTLDEDLPVCLYVIDRNSIFYNIMFFHLRYLAVT